MIWFWYFWCYSFLGFLIEVAFARLTGQPKRDRKCRLVLPLCPVYGLGALAVWLLPPAVRQSPLLLFPAAALVCSAVEYGTDLVYEKLFRVRFWNYARFPLNLNGRVCLTFSLAWGLLALPLYYGVFPLVVRLGTLLPPWVPALLLLATAADTLVTLWLLRRTGDTGSLRWYLRLGQLFPWRNQPAPQQPGQLAAEGPHQRPRQHIAGEVDPHPEP